MKICLTILVAVSAVLGFSRASLAEDIPGGIVYSDGNQVLYYEFATEQSQSLTADLKIKIKGPAAVSSNGRFLVWVQKTPKGDIFQSRTLPDGKASPTPSIKNYVKSGMRKNNLCDLPEFLPASPASLLASDIRKSFFYDLRAKPIVYMDPAKRDINIKAALPSQFGPPSFTKETNLLVWSPIRINPDENSLCTVFGNQSWSSYKSPCFPALSRNGERLAIIDQIDGRFGPIYAHGGVNPKEDYKSKSWEEVQISLKSCNGLAWRTDGTLTYLSEGKVRSVAGAVFAEGIMGTNLCWVSANILLFRDPNGYLCKWENGKVTRTAIRTPTGFSYCWRTPFSDPDEDKTDPGREKPSSGITEFNWRADGNISIGNIHVPWFPAKEGDSVLIVLRKLDGQKLLTLAKTTETELDAVKDPSSYDYSESERLIANMPSTVKTVKIKILKNQVFIVKSGNRYAVIKVVSSTTDLHSTFAWKYIPANGSDKAIAQGD